MELLFTQMLLGSYHLHVQSQFLVMDNQRIYFRNVVMYLCQESYRVREKSVAIIGHKMSHGLSEVKLLEEF